MGCRSSQKLSDQVAGLPLFHATHQNLPGLCPCHRSSPNHLPTPSLGEWSEGRVRICWCPWWVLPQPKIAWRAFTGAGVEWLQWKDSLALGGIMPLCRSDCIV